MNDPANQQPDAAKEYLPFIPLWLDKAGLSLKAFRVAAHLWRRAGRKKSCFPSIPTIGKDTGLERKTVLGALAELEVRGLLARDKRRGTSNCYQLQVVPENGTTSQCQKTAPHQCQETAPDQYQKTAPDQCRKTAPKGITSKGDQIKDTKEGLSEGPHVDDLEIYEAYPKRVGKADALKAIAEARKTLPGYKLITVVRVYAEAVADWPEDEHRFIPNPANWFRSGCYEDDPATWVRDDRGNAKVGMRGVSHANGF